MFTTIQEKLAEIETKENVRIIHCVESRTVYLCSS